MIEKLEFEGEWWFTQNPEQRFRGRLKFSPEAGVSLYLLVFQVNVPQIPAGEIDLILGSSADGKKITLYRCILKERTIHYSVNGIPAEEFLFFSSFLFVGTHFSAVEQIEFKRMSVQFLHLGEWADVSGFNISPPRYGISIIKYHLPKSIEFKIGEDLRVSVSFNVTYPLRTIPQTEASIKQNTWIVFNPSTSKKLDEFLKIMRTMQNFLTLAISESTYPTVIEGETESEKLRIGDAEICSPIKVAFMQSSYIFEPPKALHSRDMLFGLREVTRKRRILRNWFEKTEILQPVCDLYFGTLYQKGMYLNNELLNLTQALESYHRRTMRKLELPARQHQRRIATILKNAPAKHKDWLESRLKYSNEPTLRERLKDIWDRCPTAISAKLGDKNAFVGITVDTRNYWTHFDDSLKANAATGVGLYKLVIKLRILLQTCLLEEIEFDTNDIERLMSLPLSQI
jgi:hypothetical protein